MRDLDYLSSIIYGESGARLFERTFDPEKDTTYSENDTSDSENDTSDSENDTSGSENYASNSMDESDESSEFMDSESVENSDTENISVQE
jgi:hypothetical protein